MNLKKLLLGILALGLASGTAMAENITIGGSSYAATRAVDKQLSPGVQYIQYNIPSWGTYGGKVYVTIADLNNPAVQVEYITASGTTGGSTKSLKAIADANTSTGHKIVAGANANFWITSEATWNALLRTQPFGSAAGAGKLYTEPNQKNFQHIGGPAKAGCLVVGTDRKVYVNKMNHTMQIVNNRNGNVVDLDQCNRVVYNGTASIFNAQYGKTKQFNTVNQLPGTTLSTANLTNTGSTLLYCLLAPGETWKVGGDTKFIVKEKATNTGQNTLGNFDLAIVGRNSSGAPYADVLKNNYNVGDEIVLQQRYKFVDGSTPIVSESVSGNITPLVNGTFDETWNTNQSGYNDKWYARTLYGTDSTKKKFITVVCENVSGKVTGFTTRQMTDIFKHVGGTSCVQVDCGGSSQMYIDGAQVTTSTDASGIRNVHSGMFIVQVPSGPTITSSPTSWDFTLTQGEPAVYKDFVLTGSELTAAITASISNTTDYSISYPSALSTTGGTVRVTYNPQSVGNSTANLTLKSGTASLTVKITGNCLPKPLTFKQGWQQSDKSGNANSNGWDASLVRNLAYKDGKLYMVYNHSDILVVDAHNPANVLGTLKKGDIVKGGTLTLCDVKVFDGKVVACNLARKANNENLRVYVWDNDNAEPRLALNTDQFESATRLGDCIGWKYNGTWADGAFYFGEDGSDATRVLSYKVTNGTATPAFTLTRLDNAAGTAQYKCGLSMRVIPDGTGMWIVGKDAQVAHGPNPTDNISKVNLILSHCKTTWGNDIAPFSWEGTAYAFLSDFKTSAEAGNTYLGAHMQLIRYEGGWANATKLGTYPSAGLSDATRNINCATSIAVATTAGKAAEVWFCSQQQGVCYFINEGGTAPTWNLSKIGEDTPDPTPELSVSTKSVALSAEVGQSAKKTINVSGKDLTADIKLTLSGSSAISIDKTTIAKGTASGDIVITYTPSAVGTDNATLKITSTGATDITVAITGTASKTDVPTTTPLTKITELSEVWNYSVNKSTAAQPGWFNHTGNGTGTIPTRDMCFANGKLYVLNTDASTPTINIIDAYNGQKVGNLSLEGIEKGSATYTISGVKALGNTVIATNFVSATAELKVYKWASDSAKPEVLFSTTNHGSVEVGRSFNTYGTLDDGIIAYGYGASGVNVKVVLFSVKNGTVNTTPTVIELASTQGGNASNQHIVFEDANTFWIQNKDNQPQQYGLDGTRKATLATAALSNGQKYGVAADIFKYGDYKYAAITTTLGSSTVSTWGNGTMTLVDLTDGPANASHVGHYPATGLGPDSWGAVATNAVAHEINGGTVNTWVMVPHQGIAMYQFKGEPTAVQDILPTEEDAPVEFYNLQGVRISADNLTPGLYIRRQGLRSTKVLVR